MKCPRDQQELQPFNLMNSEIYSCSTCQGAWVPWNVIRTVTQRPALEKAYPTKENSTASQIVCPHDGNELREFTTPGIKIDQCATCNGLWLDKGELHQLRTGGTGIAMPAIDPTAGQTGSSISWGEIVVETLGVLFWLSD